MPLSESSPAILAKSFSKAAADFMNSNTKSIGLAGRRSRWTLAGRGPRSLSKSFGALTNAARKPSLIPSFLISGVPE